MVFNNRRRDSAWERLGQIGSQWRLESFEGPTPGTWDVFFANQRKLWGADRPNKARFYRHYGHVDPEARLLEDARRGFEEWRDHLLHWNGLCRIGESIQVIPMDSSVILLRKNSRGASHDLADLEVGILEERTFLRQHIRLFTEIYSFGTLTAPTAPTAMAFGVAEGGPTVSHLVGEDRSSGDTIALIRDGSAVQIASAIFTICT